MKALLALIKKLYGSKALSKTIGTRTNVITLPDKEAKRFVTSELNIDAASDKALENALKEVEKLIPEIPKMNDQEILTFTGNLRRLDNRLNPPSAEVIDIGTKKPVTGIEQLAAEKGQMSPPGTLMGDLESRINQLKASGKKLEDVAKGKSPVDLFEDLLKDPTRSGGPLDPKVGIVRTAAREILEKNLKAGKIDIPDEAAKDAILKSYQGGVDPIDVLRKTYGEGVLEKLDDIADELNKASDYKDIQKILQREKLLDAQPKKTYGYDEGVMSDEEMRRVLKDETPDEFATGGRVGYATGSIPKAIMAMINAIKKLDPMDAMYEANKVLKKEGKYKNLSDTDAKKIIDETEDHIFERNVKPKETDVDFDDINEPTPMSEIETLEAMGAPITAKTLNLVEKYGIDADLARKIASDPDPQRQAEAIAMIEQAMTMSKKGMSPDEIVNTFKKATDRTKQASGGLAYLMGL